MEPLCITAGMYALVVAAVAAYTGNHAYKHGHFKCVIIFKVLTIICGIAGIAGILIGSFV